MSTRYWSTGWLNGILAPSALLAALLLAACGQQTGPSGGATGGQAPGPGAPGAAAPTAAPTPAEKAAPMIDLTVGVRDDTRLGKILVDAAGKTLYTFDRDEKGKSNCTGNCLTNWPALTASGDPKKPSDLPGELETITRPEGAQQVMYNDMPLYYYAQDSAPTDTKGDGVGGVWHVVKVEPN